MSKLVAFLKKILYKYDIEIAELQSILGKMFLGLALILGVGNSSDSTYVSLIHSIPLSLLCFLLMAEGLVHLLGMIRESVRIRRNASLWAVISWCFITTVLRLHGDMVAYISATFVLSSGLIYLRLNNVLTQSSPREPAHEPNDSASDSISLKRAVSIYPRSGSN